MAAVALTETGELTGGRAGFRVAVRSRQLIARRLLMLLAILLALPGCTTGKPGTTHRKYSVYGENAAAFARSVRANAPRAGRAFGLVEITFHPDYQLTPQPKGCSATVRDVGLELVIVLPKWRQGKPVPAGVKRRWTRFRQTITHHENTHVRIARNYAARMRRAIAALRSQKDCRDLSRRIKTRIADIKAQHLRAHARYDQAERKRLKALL